MPYMMHGSLRGHRFNISLRATGVAVQLPKSSCGYPRHSCLPFSNSGSEDERTHPPEYLKREKDGNSYTGTGIELVRPSNAVLDAPLYDIGNR